MIKLLNADQIAELARFNTPTIANAIELFNVRRRDRGFLPHTIRCLLPNLPPMVGYAVTSVTTATPPDCGPTPDHLPDYLRYVASIPGPKVAVGHDIDVPAGLGAQFGEVTAGIHRQLGCVGHVTSGCPRDLDEVGAMGFALFGLNPCVSHAYVRMVDFGKPVVIGGVMIRPGDLLHGDKHGVCVIPHAVADRLADACRKIEAVEKPAIDYARRDRSEFDLEEYIRIREAMKPAAHE